MTDPLTPIKINPLIGRVNSDAHTMLYSGQRFYYTDVDKFDISIEVIAHHLARQCRWLGAMDAEHYSVAEHSSHMAGYVWHYMPFPTKRQRMLAVIAALLHDAEEFVTGDFPSPLKVLIPELSLYGDYLRGEIFNRFGIPWYNYEIVKPLDYRIRKTEAEHVENGHLLFENIERLDVHLMFMSAIAAEKMFMSLWDEAQHELRLS
jgi:hypothetical protein